MSGRGRTYNTPSSGELTRLHDVVQVPLGFAHVQSDPATLQGRPNVGKYGEISDNLAILIWIRKAEKVGRQSVSSPLLDDLVSL